MSPQEILDLQQQQQDTAVQSIYLDGVTDAAMSEPPSSIDPVYLDGYLSRLRELIIEHNERQEQMHIRWLCPAYLRGAYDA